jgi:hypothetical protein
MIAAHENVLVSAERFLGDPHARDIDLPVTKFERPGRDASQVIRSDQAALPPNRLSEKSLNIAPCCTAQISAIRLVSSASKRFASQSNEFTDELSGAGQS